MKQRTISPFHQIFSFEMVNEHDENAFKDGNIRHF